MEFKLFKDYVERICSLNAQLDVQPVLDKGLEDKVGDLTAELSKQISRRSLRDYFVFDCADLIERLQNYFDSQYIDRRIEKSNNSIIIAGDNSTYFIDGYDDENNTIFIPLTHLTGGLMCLMQRYPQVYDILWEIIEQNFSKAELESDLQYKL